MSLALAKLRLMELEAGEPPEVIAMRSSLAAFSQRAWPIIEPGTKLVWGQHHDIMCRFCEDLFWGRAPDTIINIPPGTSKSTICCVMLPAWAWLHRPSWRGLFASYGLQLSVRDSIRTRTIVDSEWYRQSFRPAWELVSDQNTKTMFGNTMRGFRFATSVGGLATGFRGDLIVVDDPHNIKSGLSDQVREDALSWYDQAYGNRLNDLTVGRRLVVMQRLHERDLSGHLLAHGGWNHLCLPAQFDPAKEPTTHAGKVDFRKEPGELLDPIRLPQDVLDRERSRLGEVGYSGQYQQRPVPASGAIFRWDRIRTVEAAPYSFSRVVRYWDKAGTPDAGAYTVGVLMGVTSNGLYYVLDVIRGRWGALDRERVIKETAKRDGPGVHIWVEQEPGSGGKESAEATIRMLAGFYCRADKVSGAGSKVVRAQPLAAQVEAGNVVLLKGEWNRAFLAELEVFPYGEFKDQVDAASGAFAKLAAAVGWDDEVAGGSLPISEGFEYV